MKPEKRHEAAAYRELREETGIPSNIIRLTNIINLSYPLEDNMLCEVWYGVLSEDFTVYCDENELVWLDADTDFTDVSSYAGVGIYII